MSAAFTRRDITPVHPETQDTKQPGCFVDRRRGCKDRFQRLWWFHPARYAWYDDFPNRRHKWSLIGSWRDLAEGLEKPKQPFDCLLKSRPVRSLRPSLQPHLPWCVECNDYRYRWSIDFHWRQKPARGQNRYWRSRLDRRLPIYWIARCQRT